MESPAASRDSSPPQSQAPRRRIRKTSRSDSPRDRQIRPPPSPARPHRMPNPRNRHFGANRQATATVRTVSRIGKKAPRIASRSDLSASANASRSASRSWSANRCCRCGNVWHAIAPSAIADRSTMKEYRWLVIAIAKTPRPPARERSREHMIRETPARRPALTTASGPVAMHPIRHRIRHLRTQVLTPHARTSRRRPLMSIRPAEFPDVEDDIFGDAALPRPITKTSSVARSISPSCKR